MIYKRTTLGQVMNVTAHFVIFFMITQFIELYFDKFVSCRVFVSDG